MDISNIERIIAIVGGIVVAIVSAIALKNDWKTPGLDNQVFKVMLALLFVGAIIALLAGAHVLGNFPKGA
ncbi:MAG: hypothetical protein KGN02_12055 [bacterium]|nr:hypothetical protein [bacterium]